MESNKAILQRTLREERCNLSGHESERERSFRFEVTDIQRFHFVRPKIREQAERVSVFGHQSFHDVPAKHGTTLIPFDPRITVVARCLFERYKWKRVPFAVFVRRKRRAASWMILFRVNDYQCRICCHFFSLRECSRSRQTLGIFW